MLEGLHAPAGDHHRREGHPGARGPPARAPAPRSPTRSAPPSPSFEGSVAIGAQTADAPDRLLFSLRGSGQALYVGLAEDAFVVASEPYGLVEETSRYLRLDGETPADPAHAAATPRAGRGPRRGARGHGRRASPASATTAPCSPSPPTSSTPRRSPRATSTAVSSRTTCSRRSRSRPRRSARRCAARSSSTTAASRCVLGADTLAVSVRERLRAGEIRRVVVIGQGTAAVAGQSLAAVLAALVGSRLRADAEAATELSGFGVSDDMSDTLVIAISQSGTTTDTNRTVDLARARGAHVIAIVNRRNSDLVDQSDGVLYTSDGRDVEMSGAVHQGVLRAGRGGLPPRARDRGRARRGRRRRVPTRSSPAARAARRDARRARAARGDLRDRAASRAVAPLLDRGRQRAQPHRRQRGADQALRALLQVDRQRRHRGQEAHRPLAPSR